MEKELRPPELLETRQAQLNWSTVVAGGVGLIGLLFVVGAGKEIVQTWFVAVKVHPKDLAVIVGMLRLLFCAGVFLLLSASTLFYRRWIWAALFFFAGMVLFAIATGDR